MCFMLYAGTTKPLPRSDWNMDDPKVHVTSLSERDAPIATHFSLPEVQCIGSTSGCGCDFPNATLSSGTWDTELGTDIDPEWEAIMHLNCEALIVLLRGSGERIVELYGIWLSRGGEVEESPKKREKISASEITNPRFCFKERCLYQVNISDEPEF